MKVLIVGCGVMGTLFARHLSKKKNLALFLYDRKKEKAELLAKELKAEAVLDLNSHLAQIDSVILAVKPGNLTEMAKTLHPHLSKSCFVISMLTGKTLLHLEAVFPNRKLSRIMPNVAIGVQKGLIGACLNTSAQDNKKTLEELLEGMGHIVWIDEGKFDAFAAVAASSPAYLLVMIEALIDGGILVGFSQETAQELILDMIEGTVALLKEKKRVPAELKWQICSPGGMTITGMKELEKGKLRSSIMRALEAAYLKSIAMGEER